MSDGGATSYWTEVYEQSPLRDLERVDSRPVERWINEHLPFVGTAVDWTRVGGSQRHWFAASDDDRPGVVIELLAELPASDGVVHVGDSLSPYAVRIVNEQLADALAALLEIPEHHYLVADDRTWCAVFRAEGDVDLALLGASQ